MNQQTTFAIRVPSEAVGHVHAFYSWIINHIGHNLPVDKTLTQPDDMEEIYTTFVDELNRHLSLERINALFSVTGCTEWTEAQHKDWLDQQTVEIHVTSNGSATAELVCKVFGPEPNAQGVINIGYEEFFKFYVDLYFKKDTDQYVVNFHSHAGKPPENTDNIVPLLMGPMKVYSYEQSKDKDPLTWNELASESIQVLKQCLKELQIPDLLIEAVISNPEYILSQTLEASYQASGAFYQPLRYRFVVECLPTQKGHLLFLNVNYSIGRNFSFYLPAVEASANLV